MAKKNLKKGLFITFEGPEGCGKTTHSGLYYRYLKSRSIKCIYTREPGGTRLGERIRSILLHSRLTRISDLAELFLFEAARSQIVNEVIRPSLLEGKIVLCDRFSDATFSYQGYGGGLPIRDIASLDRVATGGLEPDVTVLLDIDTDEGLKRASKKGVDRMEKKAVSYHKRVRAGYLKRAAKYSRRIKVVRVKGSIEEVQLKIRKELASVI